MSEGAELSAVQARALADTHSTARIFETIRAASGKGWHETRFGHLLSTKQIRNLERLGYKVTSDAQGSTVYW